VKAQFYKDTISKNGDGNVRSRSHPIKITC
jgi:hypothetical protein